MVRETLAIEVRGVAKRFGDVQAVACVDFDVREWELFGFLGPNRAGKTATINMLTGLARPDAATIRGAGGLGLAMLEMLPSAASGACFA